VIEVDTPKSSPVLVYNMQHIYAYLQLFSRWTRQYR